MKLYFYGQDSCHTDAVQLKSYISENLVPSLEEADCLLVLSGMYLSFGYGEKIEEEMEAAKQKGMPIYVIAPHGTSYIPARLRKFAEKHCDFSFSQVMALLQS